ncbi:MAG: hypothetical protein RL702_1639 [Pseudomonadota bacterium]|jgi:hypothetical protein|nr:DUF3035 domain-containing protein [Novosphingobium sp.]HOA48976.1 DUF3035 domain-containing protein [Novosphingobium sp.]HPB22930.1 DUF3035 domain-containing protein [Novosphingobium sp.]HPZ47191.1 DUF3035 domain-containing protein [Novosphingobium sp.]HQE00723.1 DUF3035 domain-containing protein [Novosphingobium sp.]
MSKTPALIVLTGAAALLAGCGSSGLLGRERPDEFAVQRQAPLVVPPDFALVPPAPGAPRPSDTSASQQAQDALFGPAQPRSAVETAIDNRAGVAAPSIRSTVGDPATNTVAKGAVTRDIVAAPEGDGREAQASAGN